MHVRAKNQAMRSKELSVELRGRIVSRHRSREGYQKMSATLKVPKNTVAIIIKWKKFGTTKTILRAGCPAKLRHRGRRYLGGDQEPDGHSDRAPEFLCGDGYSSGRFSHLCSTLPIRPTNQAVMVEWPDERHNSCF